MRESRPQRNENVNVHMKSEFRDSESEGFVKNRFWARRPMWQLIQCGVDAFL